MNRRRSNRSGTLGLVVVLLLAGLAWWVQSGSGSGSGSTGAVTDPTSGLPWVAADTLPPEARDTLRLIDRGGPYPESEDDDVFGNFEGLLPEEPRGYYREYTVRTPGTEGRGARRIVTGDDGQYYWTADHYQSFARIRR